MSAGSCQVQMHSQLPHVETLPRAGGVSGFSGLTMAGSQAWLPELAFRRRLLGWRPGNSLLPGLGRTGFQWASADLVDRHRIQLLRMDSGASCLNLNPGSPVDWPGSLPNLCVSQFPQVTRKQTGKKVAYLGTSSNTTSRPSISP